MLMNMQDSTEKDQNLFLLFYVLIEIELFTSPSFSSLLLGISQSWLPHPPESLICPPSTMVVGKVNQEN